jgi:hypothetical protein
MHGKKKYEETKITEAAGDYIFNGPGKTTF